MKADEKTFQVKNVQLKSQGKYYSETQPRVSAGTTCHQISKTKVRTSPVCNLQQTGETADKLKEVQIRRKWNFLIDLENVDSTVGKPGLGSWRESWMKTR